jgi:drug/metabolite transporter (DMT)-like permease
VSAKGLEASRNAQCKGCDGQFDSGRGANSSCPEVSESAAHAFTLSRTEKIGVVLALSGNVLISVSLNTQKYAHNQNEMRGAAKLSYLKLKLWWIGLALMAVGETGNFLAYAYAPATVVAPLGAVSVVSNCFLASWFLKEHIGMRNIIGVCLAIVGSVIIVLYAPSSDRQLTMDVLVQYKVLKSHHVVTY